MLKQFLHCVNSLNCFYSLKSLHHPPLQALHTSLTLLNMRFFRSYLIVQWQSFASLWDSLAENTDPFCVPKCHSMTGWNATALCRWHWQRWKESWDCFTRVSPWQTHCVAEQNVLTDTGSVPLRKIHSSPHPHGNWLKLRTAISSDLRLQWRERKWFHETRTQLHWVLAAAA